MMVIENVQNQKQERILEKLKEHEENAIKGVDLLKEALVG